MSKASTGIFVPKNPQKYVGKNVRNIRFRSSWERSVMVMFDDHQSVTAWSSESIEIPYQNPLTGRWTVYIPDFLVVYVDKTGKTHAEIIEVKPMKEVPGFIPKSVKTGKPLRLSDKDKLAQVINAAKWKAAGAFCARNKIKFRVATEETLFNFKRSA